MKSMGISSGMLRSTAQELENSALQQLNFFACKMHLCMEDKMGRV